MLLASARLRRAVLPTLGWGKQSTWLAASGSLAHLRAWPAPTLREGADAHRKTPVTAVCALYAGFGAVVGQYPYRGYLDGVGPRVGRRLSGPSEFRERTPPGAGFWALWGRSILVLG